jgi:urease subunit gamma
MIEWGRIIKLDRRILTNTKPNVRTERAHDRCFVRYYCNLLHRYTYLEGAQSYLSPSNQLRGGNTLRLVPRELDKLQIFTAARIAERRLKDGVKLNHPEAVAYIADFALERIRRGDTVAQVMEEGKHVLTTEDVMPGVPELIPMIAIEGTFPDGTKLVSIHHPIQPKGAGKGKGAK